MKGVGLEKIKMVIGGSVGGMEGMELVYNNEFEMEKGIIVGGSGKR